MLIDDQSMAKLAQSFIIKENKRNKRFYRNDLTNREKELMMIGFMAGAKQVRGASVSDELVWNFNSPSASTTASTSMPNFESAPSIDEDSITESKSHVNTDQMAFDDLPFPNPMLSARSDMTDSMEISGEIKNDLSWGPDVEGHDIDSFDEDLLGEMSLSLLSMSLDASDIRPHTAESQNSWGPQKKKIRTDNTPVNVSLGPNGITNISLPMEKKAITSP